MVQPQPCNIVGFVEVCCSVTGMPIARYVVTDHTGFSYIQMKSIKFHTARIQGSVTKVSHVLWYGKIRDEWPCYIRNIVYIYVMVRE